MRVVSKLGLILISALSVFVSHAAFAAQNADVLADAAPVHQFANASSPQVGTLPQGTQVKVSNDIVRDVRGEYWYKVRLPSGELGYVRAKDIRPQGLDQEMRSAGLQPTTAREREGVEDERESGASSWAFVLRAMGIAGYESKTPGFEAGGEGEFSISLMPGARGYERRMLSIGPVAQFLTTDTMIGGSLIYRVYNESEVEPELRLRGGYGLNSGAPMAGANIGVRYPFSLDSGPHFSGYVEAGVLASFKANTPTHLFGSAGVGYHF